MLTLAAQRPLLTKTTKLTSEEVLALFKESGAMLEGHFELSSGLHSDRYFQCALLLQDPPRAEKLSRVLADRIDLGVECVIGPALGAVTFAYELARAIGVRGLFSERKEGQMLLRRGFSLRPGERVLVCEDVLTTGGSAKEVTKLVRELGAEPVAVASILNRSGGNPFEAEGLPLFALAEAKVEAYEASDCPACGRGDEVVKPGSKLVQGKAGA